MNPRTSPPRRHRGLAAFGIAALLAMAATAQVSNLDGTAALAPPDPALLAAALGAAPEQPVADEAR